MDSIQIDRLFKEGVAAIRGGDEKTGREILKKIVSANPLYEQAWLWLSAVVESREERIICLENVLTINPFHETARKGLIKLGQEPPPLPERTVKHPPEEDEGKPVEISQQPQVATPVDRSPLLAHGHASVTEDRIDALLSGQISEYKPPEPPVRKRREIDHKDVDSQWSRTREKPQRTLKDLVYVWFSMMIFNVYAGFDDEVEYGGGRHFLINISIAGILKSIAVLIFLAAMLASAHRSIPLPVLSSADDYLQQGLSSLSGASDPTFVGGIMRNAGRMLQSTYMKTGFSRFSHELPVTRDLLSAAIVFFLASIPAVFLKNVYGAFFLNGSLNMMRAKANYVHTLQVVSLIEVVISLMLIPFAVITVFLKFSPGFLSLMALYAFYQFSLYMLAVVHRHDFNFRESVGALIMGFGGAGFLLIVIIQGLLMLF